MKRKVGKALRESNPWRQGKNGLPGWGAEGQFPCGMVRSTVGRDGWGQPAEQWECAQCQEHVQTVVRAAAQFAQTNKNQVKGKENTAEERKEGGRRKGKTSRKWRRIETMYLSPKFKCKNLKKKCSQFRASLTISSEVLTEPPKQ